MASGVRVFGICLASVALCFGAADAQKTFSTPMAAVVSLITSIENDDYTLYLSTVGPDMRAAWTTGDPVRDALDRERLLADIDRASLKPDPRDPNSMVLYLGARAETFPAPLVRSEDGWRFDGVTGSRELINRLIRRNELAAVDLCQQYVDAQLAYSAMDHGPGAFGFARKIRATPGHQNGLYWSGKGGEDHSPEGPLFAAAAYTELQPSGTPRPYFGYYFKILLRQGPDAIGGMLDYQVAGELARGFALIAWPAEYGVTGINSFLINHRGTLYERDLGPGTPRIAADMTVFNPDPGWTRAFSDGDGEEK